MNHVNSTPLSAVGMSDGQ